MLSERFELEFEGTTKTSLYNPIHAKITMSQEEFDTLKEKFPYIRRNTIVSATLEIEITE